MIRLAQSDLHWARSASTDATGVLVLAGSSGRLDANRADVLADAGATALAIRWFGGNDQPSTPVEIPLETFTYALGLLAGECERLAIVGLSYGAEAALLTAVRDPRVDAVVALAPTDVVWEGHRDSDAAEPRSKWSWQGEPVPFVPMTRDWAPTGEIAAFTSWYEASRKQAGATVLEEARIPVEQFNGELVLVAGGDDQVWPSLPAAREILAEREATGLLTTLVEDPAAGHPVVLPGESQGDPRRSYSVGGDARSAHRLGESAWPAIREALRLHR